MQFCAITAAYHCILRYHCLCGLVQQYEQMLEDMLDGNEPAPCESECRQVAIDQDKIQQALSGDRNFSVSCELGVRYPVLKAMLSREDQHIRPLVRPFTCYRYNTIIYNSYVWYMSVLYYKYICQVYGIYLIYTCLYLSYI